MNRPPSSLRSGIPACAWMHPLGERPVTTTGTRDVAGNLDTPARAKKGIPLGGIGAGNFMFNLCGTFGPWHMKPGRYEEHFLPQAAFHLYEKLGDANPTLSTLATEDVLPAWQKLTPGQGSYHGLFPRGWCIYEGFHCDVSLQFFSPIIKDNYRETSLPVAVFLFEVHNPTDQPAEVAVMFTFPNAPYTGPHGLKFGAEAATHEGEPSQLSEAATRMKKMLDQMYTELASERGGLSNQVVQNGDQAFVVMSAGDPQNPPETQHSQWCIGAAGSVSCNAAWDGAGDGSDIWQELIENGQLTNRTNSNNSALPAGAIALNSTLQPGQRQVLPFVLSWYFPQVEFSSGTRWWRKYTEFFPPGKMQAGGYQSVDIAREALQNYPQWLNEVEGWTGAITANPVYPDWLKQAALNELYYSTFGGSFWENGCITKPKKFGARTGQQLSFVMECQEYRYADTLDVRHHASRSNRDLWPLLERDLLLAYADFIMDNKAGACPHDAGSPNGDPFFVYDAYAQWDPYAEPGNRYTHWSEFSPKFIQQSYAYWVKAGDDAFLRDVWPALVRSFEYQKSTDTDGDGITEMKSSEYRDNKLFNAVLWIGSLQMLEKIAAHLGHPEMAVAAHQECTKARASAEQQFWNPDLGYYQFNAEKPDLMGDAFIGQLYVDAFGLPPTLTPERITSHYRQIYRRLVAALHDTEGDGVGNVGVANVLRPDGSPAVGDSEFEHEFEVWTGVSYALAASLYHWGKQIGDGALQAEALLTGCGVYQATWQNPTNAYWFSTPEAWRIDSPSVSRALMYQRPRAVWELLTAIQDPFLQQASENRHD